jgi:hypothetical protein
MMNVSKLSASIREEEEIPYPSSPPPFIIITDAHPSSLLDSRWVQVGQTAESFGSSRHAPSFQH